MRQGWVKQIQDRVKGVPIKSGRSNKVGRIGFEDLVFVPAQLGRLPVDYFMEEILSATLIGKESSRSIEIRTPIVFGAMSYGALSKEAKTALAKGSSLAGTMQNTGEGGVLFEDRKFSNKLIAQYSTGRFGITEEILKKADAIEIKIGQGAKPGQGGLLKKEKITSEVAEVRKIERGKNVHSPACHADIKNISDLRERIDWLRRLTDGVPIIIKLGAGSIESDVEFAVRAGPDVIAVDGLEGGSGAAPEVMLDEVGVPTVVALSRTRRTLDKLGARQELWVGGGLNKGGDVAKALALGADAVFVGFSLLVAMGCVYCQQCYAGKCQKGIATQDLKLRGRLNVEEASVNVGSFINNCTEEVKMVAGACGKKNVHDLSKEDLRALSPEVANITGTKFVGD